MKRLLTLVLSFICLISVPQCALADTFSVTFDWTNSFRIYGHQPVPQTNGFDYYFSPEQINTGFAGNIMDIESIQVSGYGNNLGSVINFDWEVHISGSDIDLPEGQFMQTHVDPVSGYTRNAETQYLFSIGSSYDSNSYLFQGDYDFTANSGSAYPYLATIKEASTQQMNITDGLHVQMFLWTADNRNNQIQFDNLSLTVTGNTTPPVIPEPISSILFITGGALLAGRRYLERKRNNRALL